MDIPSIKYYMDIDYQAGSWRQSRLIVAKIERNAIGANQRFIVTDLSGDAEQLHSQVYCERGTMEHRHEELRMGLFADRTSCSAWWSNQLQEHTLDRASTQQRIVGKSNFLLALQRLQAT